MLASFTSTLCLSVKQKLFDMNPAISSLDFTIVSKWLIALFISFYFLPLFFEVSIISFSYCDTRHILLVSHYSFKRTFSTSEVKRQIYIKENT